MAVKLQGIEPRPPAPAEPSVRVERLPTDDESLIRIWRPQAQVRAQQGDTEFAVARFLRSKGVTGEAARAAARSIMDDPDPGNAFGTGLAKVSGIILLILSLILPVVCFGLQLSGMLNLVALAGCLIGVGIAAKLLWPGPPPPAAGAEGE